MTPAGALAAGPLFVDTWAWIALANIRDPAHEVVVKFQNAFSRASRSWITTDYVLDETITRVFRRMPFSTAAAFYGGMLHARQIGWLVVERIGPKRFDEAYRMRLRYRDKPRISFTDFSSFVVMRELGIRQVLTEDADFVRVGLGFELRP